MSSHTNLPEDALWVSLNKILATIPLDENRDTLLRYLQERAANGIKPSTLGIDANCMRAFMIHLDAKSVEKAERKDVIAYLNNAHNLRRWCASRKDGTTTVVEKAQRLSPSTINKRKEILKPFFKWLRQTDDEPPEVKNLRSKKTDGDAVPVDQLITRDDLAALLQVHPDAQEKARIAVLYDSGLRASEFCSLHISSVVFDQYGAVITLPKGAPGLKTGSRRVRLFESVPYLQAWFEAHPNKKDPRAALWISTSHRAPGIRLSSNALWHFVFTTGVKAKLGKDIWPHLFRHTAATERARLGWNEGQMRAFFGWAKDSDMPSVYVHLAGMDYENVELERRGLKGMDERGASALLPIECAKCNTQNPLTSVFCVNCRYPIAPEAEEAMEKQRLAEIEAITKKHVEEKVSEHLAKIARDRDAAERNRR